MIALIRSERRGLLLSLCACFLLLGIIEIHLPYYFLQDDGLEYFLPSYFHNWHSLSSGHFPLYNFHTFGGVPHFSMGQPGTFYFPQYVAIPLSYALFGNVFAAIDILAIFHLFVAAAGMYLLLRYRGIEVTASVFGSITVLSGFFLIVGRMWPPALMLCAWFPWMLLAAESFNASPGPKRGALLVAVRLALFYGGYPQFFVLAMIFEHLFIILRPRSIVRRPLLLYAALAVATFLLACPLLLPMATEVQRSQMRSAPLSYHDFSNFSLPFVMWAYGEIFAGVPIKLDPREWFGALLYLSHVGYVTSVLSLCAIPALFKRQHRMRALLYPCFACCVLSLLWTWNVLGPGIYHLPLLNRFRWPFKLVYFSGFFQCVVAATMLNGCRKRWQYLAIAAFACGWLYVYCILPSHAWRMRDHRPPLATVWKKSLTDGRYVVLAKDLVHDQTEQFIGFNYAELWGLDNLLGYEPLIAAKGSPGGFGGPVTDGHSGAYPGDLTPQVLDRFRTWSVTYILVNPESAAASKALETARWRSVATRDGWQLWQDPEALPRVRWDEGSTTDGMDSTVGDDAIEITLRGWPGKHLTLAYTANPGLESCIEASCSAITPSADGLVHIEVPLGTRSVRLVYRNWLFKRGVEIATATMAMLTLAVMWFRVRQAKKLRQIHPQWNTLEVSS